MVAGTSDPSYRARMGRLSDKDAFDYEKQRHIQMFRDLDKEQVAAEEAEKEAAERAAIEALGPKEAAYRELYGSPSPDYIASLERSASPNWVEEDPGWNAPMASSTGAPTAPPEAQAAQAGPPSNEAEGRDSGAELSELLDRYMGPDGLLRKAESTWDTRRGEIAEQYRGGDEARFTQAQQELNKAKTVLGRATEKLANWEINPQRAFPNAFSKISAVISVAMGAYAQGLSGQKMPNTALQIIQGAIKNDIDAQKMEYQKLKGLVDEKRNVYGMAMRMLGNAEQAEQVAYSAAYQTYQAEINKIGKEYGLEYGAINLASEIDDRKQRLAVSVVKGGKIPTDMRKSMTAFGSLKDKMRRMWSLSKDINAVRSYLDVLVPGETKPKEFNRLAEQAASDMVYAVSGVTSRKEEYDRARKWAPKATDLENMRIAKMVGIMEYSLERGTEHYAAMTPAQKAGLSQELRAMYEMTAEQRRGAILTLLEGQGHDIQVKGWEAEVGGIKSSMKSDGWLEDSSGLGGLGGERVTGKK